jgi:hypothetical protein
MQNICDVVKARLLEDYDALEVGQVVDSLGMDRSDLVIPV